MFFKLDFKIDELEFIKLFYEMEKYWFDIDCFNKFEYIFVDSGIVMDVNGVDSFFDVIVSVYDVVNGIEIFFEVFYKSDEELKLDFEVFLIKKGVFFELFSDILYYENFIENRNWELYNFGVLNLF